MLDRDFVLCCEEVAHDLYEEDGFIFGIELDLFNGHQSYYCKTSDDHLCCLDLGVDIYQAIDQFNDIITRLRN